MRADWHGRLGRATAAAPAGRQRSVTTQRTARAACPQAASAPPASRLASQPAAQAGAAAPSRGRPRQPPQGQSTTAVALPLPPRQPPRLVLPQPLAVAGAASPPRPASPATAAAIAAQRNGSKVGSLLGSCCWNAHAGGAGTCGCWTELLLAPCPLACARASIAAFSSAASARRSSTLCCRSRCATLCNTREATEAVTTRQGKAAVGASCEHQRDVPAQTPSCAHV